MTRMTIAKEVGTTIGAMLGNFVKAVTYGAGVTCGALLVWGWMGGLQP